MLFHFHLGNPYDVYNETKVNL